MRENWDIFIVWSSGEYSGGESHQFPVSGTEEEVAYLVDELNCKYEDFMDDRGSSYDYYVYRKSPTVVDIFNLSAEAIERVAYEHVK